MLITKIDSQTVEETSTLARRLTIRDYRKEIAGLRIQRMRLQRELMSVNTAIDNAQSAIAAAKDLGVQETEAPGENNG